MSRAEDLIARLEAREAPLYHFVNSFWGFDQITAKGKALRAHSLSERPKEYGISLTRNPNLGAEGEEDSKAWGPIRLTFDQAKLTTKYKIEPYNFFGTRVSGSLAGRGPARHQSGTESEELLLTDKAGLSDFWKYVTRVDIIEPESEGEENSLDVLMGRAIDMKALENDLAALDKLGVPWSYVDSFDPAKARR